MAANAITEEFRLAEASSRRAAEHGQVRYFNVRRGLTSERVMGVEAIAIAAVPEGNRYISDAGAAKGAAAACPPVPADADLRAVVEAWPTLPKALRAGILAMVDAAKS